MVEDERSERRCGERSTSRAGPLAAAATTAVVSLLLMYLAARGEWLGPDVGRGDGFCEAARTGLVKQPANALSNLGFVVAGLAVGWHAGLPAGRLARPGLATTYAVVVVLLGPGSMAMHATQSELGGRLDQLSMYLVACFALAYALMRATRRSTGYFLTVFAGLLVLCEVVEQWHADLAVVDNTGNLVFGIILVAAISIEVWLRRQGDRSLDVRWVLGAVGGDRHRLRDLEPLEERHRAVPPALAAPGARRLARALRRVGLVPLPLLGLGRDPRGRRPGRGAPLRDAVNPQRPAPCRQLECSSAASPNTWRQRPR